MPREDVNVGSVTVRITADAEPALREIRRVRAELDRLPPSASWPVRILLLLVVLIDVLSPFGSTVFLPKPVDTVIDLLWIALNGAGVWCAVLQGHAWWSQRKGGR